VTHGEDAEAVAGFGDHVDDRRDHDGPIPVITMPISVITMRRSWRSRCPDPGDHDRPKHAGVTAGAVDGGVPDAGRRVVDGGVLDAGRPDGGVEISTSGTTR
jgi:hypothetical protein